MIVHMAFFILLYPFNFIRFHIWLTIILWHCAICQAVRCSLLTTEPWVQSWVTSHEIYGGWNGTEWGFSPPCFFNLNLLISIPPSFLTYQSLPKPGSALSHPYSVHWGFICEPEFGWLQSKEVYVKIHLCNLDRSNQFNKWGEDLTIC